MNEFNDPFANIEQELAGLTGPPDGPDQRLARALWEAGTENGQNKQIGDARVTGYLAVAEFEDTEGNRWLRFITGSGQGRQIPTWQAQGYIAAAEEHCSNKAVVMVAEPPAEGFDDE